VNATEPRLLIVGGAVSEAEAPSWEGYRCTCLPRSRARFCDLRHGVWSAKIDPGMLDAFVAEAASYDAVFCETGEALLLVTEWRARGIPLRPILALEVDGLRQAAALGAWYEATRGKDPIPALLEAPWVSWLATSEEQASRLEAAGVPPEVLHRVPTGASLFSMLSPRAAELLDPSTVAAGGVEVTSGAVLFPGIGRRDWGTILDAIVAMPDLACVIVGGPLRELQRRLAARKLAWPTNLRHVESLPLERYIEVVRAATVAVVPLLPGRGDGGHSTIAIVHRLGVPLVSTDSPALRDYLDDGRAAHLCAPGDSRDLVRAIRDVVGDASLRGTLAAAGRRAEALRDVEFRRGLPAAIERARASLPSPSSRAAV
jgi:glycosyltransferase involved in cell wall biosynthesis